MKLNLLSDLHLSQGALPRPCNDADVVVLAGDIARPDEAVAWASGFDRPVLYVPGNHEFYGGSLPGTRAELRRLCAGTRIELLDDEVRVIDGVRFLGSTLWTDFLLFSDPDGRSASVEAAFRFMRDFSRIRISEDSEALFTPLDAALLFRRHEAWLAQRLAEPHAGPTVVITHHAPSPRSIHPRFAGSPLNACFVSNAEHLLDGRRAQLWIHGHTHDSFDYTVNGTRVVCNPRGYARGGINENARFDPDFKVEVTTG
ncbi:metallophosphoesterase [Variovorax terrae]|uniref:Metallophosphoesterase n=1 Tax=Variovorax terrae TaxID=2923278 RepID=A0A9X1VQ60_9BURK|nr:metallophosphoesterase [Variovorax terrae]MCJ0761771.1 metallophosphoesterase [Variovorax terrae]